MPQDFLPSGSALKEFALTDNIKSKSDMAFGLRVAKEIYDTTFGANSYYNLRNARFAVNEELASGKMDIYTRFADRFDMNGKQNYINLSWKSIKIANTIISRLVGRWMNRREKIQVTSVDDYSKKEKKKKEREAEFVLDNKELLGQLIQQSGVPVVGADDYIAEDKDDLDAWAAEFNNLPEEIKYELKCNNILDLYGWFDVIKEQILHNSSRLGLIGAYVVMNENGQVIPEYLNPFNIIYSYSNYADFRDTKWRGYLRNWTISEIRQKYPKLDEEELYNIAVKARNYRRRDKLTWDRNWIYSYSRPYDDWNIDIVCFEYKSYDTEVYRSKTTPSGTLKIDKNPTEINKGERIEKGLWNIYEGVYLSESQKMLEWGIKKNMIAPQDPKEIGDAEFSYSFYMYQPDEMRNVAVPEKIEEPVEEMILTRLKIQQLVMKSRPPGAMINEDALQSIDYGLGDANNTVDPKKHFDQTGDIYFRGRDGEGNPIPVPITELQNSGFLTQMQGYMQAYQFHYQVLKDELGEDPNLINAASQPRVAVQNIQASQSEAQAATDYMYDAYVRLTEDVARKIACLLHDSIREGASAYKNDIGKDDVNSRVFETKVKSLPTDQDIAILENFLSQALAGNPDLYTYLDPYKVIRMAREDVKLGYLYYTNAMKRMIKSKMDIANQQSQMNAQVQVQSMQAKSESDNALKDKENQAKEKQIILQGMFDLFKVGAPLTPDVTNVMSAIIKNIAVPLFSENIQQGIALQQQMQQLAQAQQQQQEGQPQPEQPAAPIEQQVA